MKKKPKIIFELEKEIFYLFSFLNLIGYDEENNPEGMHPLRKFVRKTLKSTLKFIVIYHSNIICPENTKVNLLNGYYGKNMQKEN
jgi:hypothetical protein